MKTLSGRDEDTLAVMSTTDQKKVRKLLADAEGADHELLRARDMLLSAFRVSVAGVDVTRAAGPQLEPEVAARRKKEAPEPKPSAEGLATGDALPGACGERQSRRQLVTPQHEQPPAAPGARR